MTTIESLRQTAEQAQAKSDRLAERYNREWREGKWSTNRPLAGACEDAFSTAAATQRAYLEALPKGTCRHCGHGIALVDGTWIAPDAGTDVENGDGIWRESCPDNHEDRIAAHEPEVTP